MTELVLEPAVNSNVATLIDTKLGDVLMAEILKDPSAVGRMITKAVTEAEASVAPATPDAKVGPKPDSAPQAAE